MITFTAIIFILLYGYCYVKQSKSVNRRISPKAAGIIKTIHYVVLLLCLIAIGLNNYNLAFRGLYTTRGIVAITLLTGVLLYLFAPKKWRFKAKKIYFRAFSWLPLFFLGLLTIPLQV